MGSEFPKVFPNDFPRISPNRKIDFEINLLLDIHPIPIPPYRMALVELMELKEQLKDPLDKGFICPSVSPWVLRYFLCVKWTGPFGCV